MSVLLQESFDFSTVFDAANYGVNWANLSGQSIVAGRTGNCANFSGSTSKETVGIGTPGTIIIHLAIKLPAVSQQFMYLRDGVSGVVHGALQFNAGTRRIGAYRSTTTLLGETADNVLIENTWNHIQVKWTVSDTVGVVQVKVNNVTVLNLTGQDTQNSANAYVQSISFAAPGNDIQIDDLIIVDTAGGAPWNDFLGDVKIVPYLSDGAGNYSAWTPSAGVNYQNIDDTTPDGDTTYNSASVNGDKDSYAIAAVGVTGAVFSVRHLAQMRKDDAGSRNVRLFMRVGGVDYPGSDIGLSDSYVTYARLHETNPNTGVQWIVSGVDGAEVGQEARP
jgi:hypothetical protein